jgi:hypothetical protein
MARGHFRPVRDPAAIERETMRRFLCALTMLALITGCPIGNRNGDLCEDSATRCDDNNPCTNDSCVQSTGACENVALDCPEGDICNPLTGDCI